ncbi:MAG: hypothetical protein JRN16_04025 [Nitrososphaerota archaeon]|nr:hypothetical protein [Nitrososphaerota archaeon]MDG7027561.1 hypothetical protein [Nitrososphaerota archaeon]
MKIATRRRAISQSMDLFIIIAAVLGVGGIVTASIYNLINSATTNSSVTVVGASLVAGSTSSAAPSAMSVTVKNDGGSAIDCANGGCQVVISGSDTGSTPGTACTACIVSSPTGWTASATTDAPLTFVFAPTTETLAPGAQASFLVSGPVFTGTTLTGMPTPGSMVTLNVIFGSASTQVTVVAQ